MPYVLILLVLFMGLYVIAQTFTLWRLIQLVRRPGHFVRSDMAQSCVVRLCVLPGVMLLLFAGLVGITGGAFLSGKNGSNADPLTLLTFSPYGVLFASCSWVAMTGWFAMIIARPQSLYRSPISLVPIVILALICLTFSLGVCWVGAKIILRAPGLTAGQMSWGHVALWVILAVMFYIPTATLVGFVLLIIHVARMLPSDGRVTMVASESESESEGDMP